MVDKLSGKFNIEKKYLNSLGGEGLAATTSRRIGSATFYKMGGVRDTIEEDARG